MGIKSNNLDYFNDKTFGSNIEKIVEYIDRYNYYIEKPKNDLYQIYKNCGFKGLYYFTKKSSMSDKLTRRN